MCKTGRPMTKWGKESYLYLKKFSARIRKKATAVRKWNENILQYNEGYHIFREPKDHAALLRNATPT